MTNTQHEDMVYYLGACDIPWELKGEEDCDICIGVFQRANITYWIGVGTPPFLCEPHACDFNLLW